MRDEEEFELLKRLVDQKDRELESVFDAIADGIGKFVCNEEFSILYYNDGLAKLCGVDRGVVEEQGFNSSLYIYAEDQPRLERVVQNAAVTGEPFSITYRLVHADGRHIWVKTNGVLTDELYQDEYPIMYLFYTDVTDVVETSERLRIEVERQRIFMELTGEMFVEYDHVADDLALLGAYAAYYDASDRIERFSRFADEHPDDVNADAFRSLYEIIARDDGQAVERCFPRSDGRMVWFSIKGRTICDESGEPQKSLYRINDIDEQKRERETLRKRASTDDLTGAYSQGTALALVNERLKHAEARATGVFMLFDLDGFKGVNDEYGHPRGDDVLVGAVAALKCIVRDRDIVGRIGGDEFCVYLDALGGADEAKAVAQRICEAMPDVGMKAIGAPVTCSIGMSSCVGGNKTYDRLYEEADRALYRAKGEGRDGFALFGDSEADR